MSKMEPSPGHIGSVLEKMDEVYFFAPDKTRVKYEIIPNPKDGYPGTFDQLEVISFLYSHNAIQISSLDHRASYVVDFLGGGKGIIFEPISPTFKELRKKYPAQRDSASNEASAEYWITRDDKGEYWFAGNKVHFTNTNSEYAKIFRATYSSIPHGGTVPYRKIIEQYRDTNKKAIQRALTGSDATLFRYAQNINRTLDFGVPLFEAMKDGKGIKFNNQR